MRSTGFIATTIWIVASACSGELAERPAARDPANVAAAEAPFTHPPAYEPDLLLSPVPPKGNEPQPTGEEPAHSATSTPPGNPPYREAPGARTPVPPEHHHSGGQGTMPGMQHDMPGMQHDMPDTEHEPARKAPAKTVYTCPMHPQVRSNEPGRCPICGMTLVPADKGGTK